MSDIAVNIDTTKQCAICHQDLGLEVPHTYMMGLAFHTTCYERATAIATSSSEAEEAIRQAVKS